MKIIDLSKTIEYRKSDPWFMRIKVKNKSHKQSQFLIRRFLKLPKELFPEKLKVAVFPLKIKSASAAPARVVAIFNDELDSTLH